MKLHNFGGNVEFDASRLAPVDEAAVVAHLEENRRVVSRAIGSLHSWSDATVTSRAFDLRHFRRVQLTREGGQVWADIEAGCTINAVLDYLRQHGDYTLPAYGIIGKQTIAGAISTATHGSGRPSMSHYVSRITAAAFDAESGHARTYTWESGDALRAARCGVGCAGIVLSVRMPVEPEYLLEERTALFDRVESVIELEDEYPRQQFYLIPWSWKWLAQLRRPLGPPAAVPLGPRAWLRRWTTFLRVDVLMHGVVRLLAGYLRWWGALRWFYRNVVSRGVGAGTIVDRSRYIFQMRHDLYRHVEMELFVPASHVVHAAAFVEWVLRWCGGESPAMPEVLRDGDFGFDAADRVKSLRGSYFHDYLITFRHVLADDTLISMTSGEVGAWYAVSLITYQRDREPFLRVAEFLARAMASAYGGRPHWGKVCPLGARELTPLYPSLSRFRAHCAAVDPFQIFVSDFARRTLGFS
jgi:FAD/FMN-containing dehydrogenase